MNLDLTLKEVAIAKVSLRVKEKDDVVRRIVRVTFSREFDDEIADALGKEAKQARKALKDYAMVDATIPLEEIVAKAKITCGFENNAITVAEMTGVRAKGKCGKEATDKKEATPPKIELSFDMPFAEAPWTFFGRNARAWATLELSGLQRELPNLDPAKAPNGQAKSRANGATNGHANGHAKPPKAAGAKQPKPLPGDEDLAF